jgi:CelD/BcsL family acetyltransferase involved in cellulose biosynthesis
MALPPARAAEQPPRGAGHEVIEVSELGGYAPAWDELAEDAPLVSPFLRSWWLDGVRTEHTSFVLVLRGDDLEGGLPITRESKRGIERIGLGCGTQLWPHGLDVVARSNARERVASAVYEHLLAERPRAKVFDLIGTFPESALATCAPPRAQRSTVDEWMTATLPSDFETYLAQRNRHLRQEIRRTERRLVERGVSYRTDGGDDGFDAAFTAFESLHRLRWSKGGSGFLASIRRFEAAARGGFARKEVVFHEVVHEDRVLASLVTLEIGDQCSLYQMGRDPDPAWSGTGLFLRACAVRRSCELGHTTVDFGPGSAEIKKQWTDTRRAVLRITWGHGIGRAVFGWRAMKRPLVGLERETPISTPHTVPPDPPIRPARTVRAADARFVIPVLPRTALALGEPAWEAALLDVGVTKATPGTEPDLVVTTRALLGEALRHNARTVLVTDSARVRSLRRRGYRCEGFVIRSGRVGPRMILPTGRRSLALVALVERSETRGVRRLRNQLGATLIRLNVAWGSRRFAMGTREQGDLPALCSAGLQAAGIDGAQARWYLQLGDGDDLQSAAFHIGSRPDVARWVAKFGRIPSSRSRFELEWQGIELIERAGPDIAAHVPTVMGRTFVADLPISAETAARGPTLAVWLRRTRFGDFERRRIEEIAAWIIELGKRSTQPPASLDRERVRLRDEVLAHWLGSGAPADLVERLPPVPGVAQHNDIGTWNIMGDASAWTVLDWEDAEETGLPLWDLLYFLTDALSTVEIGRVPGDAAENALHALALLRGELPTSALLFDWLRCGADALSVPLDAVAPIVTLSWLHHAGSYAKRQARLQQAPGTSPVPVPYLGRIGAAWLADPRLGAAWPAWR